MLVKIRDFIRKYTQITFFIGLFIVGVAFAIIGAITLSQPQVEGVETTATIVEITKEEGGTNADGYTEFIYTVYVDYTDKDGVAHSKVEWPIHEDDMVVGKQITVKYDPANPGTLVADNSPIVSLIFVLVGIAAAGFAVYMIVKAIKQKNINEFDRVDMSHVTEAEIARVRDNTEETKEYFFHFTGKANQDYVLETIERTPVYEALCDKIGIVSQYEFTFVNHLTGDKTHHRVSHVVTSSFDGFVNSSKFKIDDVSVWDVLAKEGYAMEPHLNGLKSYFDVSRFGIPVAKIELAGTKAYKDNASKLFGDVPIQGMFRVEAKESDIEYVFLCAFALSKVELV